ncbi:MAG: PD-(D/E)XK nuclease family protein, partial [Thermodesulfobium sp.]
MIREIVEKNLPLFSQKETEEKLGNREGYLGASDISGCPRKTILGKFAPVDNSTETFIKFLRGHIAEQIISNALKETKYLWKTQYEVSLENQDVPITAHLDFVVYNKDWSKILVIEVKSVSGLPTEPYGSWQNQLYLQIGLLKSKFPQAIIKGSIFAVDISSGKYTEFDGFEHNEPIYNLLIEKAEGMWETYQRLKETGDESGIETEAGPLCAYCPFKRSCSEFSGNELVLPDEIKNEIVKFSELQSQEKEIKENKERI